MKFLKFLLLTIVILILLALGLYVYARYIEPNLLIVNRVALEDNKLANPIKIVFFGDTHLGEFSDINKLNKIVDKINAENPDLVIFTGDLIDSKAAFTVDPEAIAQSLCKIHATYGKYCVIGNHEYALTKTYNYKDLMNAGGFELLLNDWLDLSDLNVRILGLDDAFSGEPDINLGDQALDGAYNIMMTHEPDIVDKMNLVNVQLVLAGHTHGGQISLPFSTARILPANGKKYVKGLFSLGSEGQTKLFVTKGTGMTTLPFRFMNVPEIVSIEIRP
ncbi:MAG: metallophosphoesterase [Acetobacterium woodii]|nr:metallophosphoesterase [Acetobacterium woodii]